MGNGQLGMGERGMFGLYNKLLTYIEYRAVSGVFLTIDPPPPLDPSKWSSPRTEGGGYTLAGRWGGGGVNISEDARHWIDLLQYNPSTGYTHRMSWFTCAELWLTTPIYYQWLKGCTLYCTNCTCVMFCGSEIFSNHLIWGGGDWDKLKLFVGEPQQFYVKINQVFTFSRKDLSLPIFAKIFAKLILFFWQTQLSFQAAARICSCVTYIFAKRYAKTNMFTKSFAKIHGEPNIFAKSTAKTNIFCKNVPKSSIIKIFWQKWSLCFTWCHDAGKACLFVINLRKSQDV